MKLVALVAARNESWIIGCSLRAALLWNDVAVVLNHASTDRTGEIVAEIASENPGRVHIINEPNPLWAEMDHRQRMLEEARRLGATHISYCDADEILTGNLVEPIREQIESLPAGGYLQTAMPCVWRGLERYRDDTSVFGAARTMLAFRDRADLGWFPKADGYQFHAREPRGARMAVRISKESGGVMHLQFADWRRLVAKHQLYKITELLRWPGRKTAAEVDALYSMATTETNARFTDIPAEWWEPYEGFLRHIDLNQEPWQEAECRRLWALHGPGKFEGLNLHGIVTRELATARA